MSRSKRGKVECVPRKAPPRGRRRALSRTLLALFVVGGVALGGWAWRSSSLARNRAEGLRLAGAGRFADAEPHLVRAVEHFPEDIDIVKALALGYVQARREAEAEAYLLRWRDLQPRIPQPHHLLLDLLQPRGRNGPSLAAAERLLEVEPDNDDVQRRYIRMLLEEGRYADAEAACRAFLTRSPSHPGLLFRRADCLIRLGRKDEARAILDGVLAKHPNLAPPMVLRAVLHREEGEEDKALPLLRRAVELDLKNKEAHYQLGSTLTRAGQAEDGARHLAEYDRLNRLERLLRDVAIQPDNNDLKVQAAALLVQNGQRQEAVKLLREVLAREPDHAEAKRLLGE